MLAFLEVTIGLSLTFLAVAIFASAITEWLSNLLSMRSRFLWSAVRHLVSEPVGREMESSHLIQSRSTTTGG